MSPVKLTVDHDADAAYIRLSDAAVAHTVEITDDVLVDVDDLGDAVGIELLDLNAEIPFSDLTRKCHIRSDVIEAVRTIQPSIS